MAHLLSQAKKRGLRRIFVVLPFTSIIKQSVDEYRKALALDGEDPRKVVAELHHLADFEDEDARHMTALWRAPIIVTTAVAFFETLASKGAAPLRKLHELPGSAIFVDEAHAAMPVRLLPIAWRWMNIYAEEWSCYWVLASGSLNRFWEIKEIKEASGENNGRNIPSIVGAELRKSLNAFEQRRVRYIHCLRPKTVAELYAAVRKSEGPRLVIVNTVKNAAIIAKYFREKAGRKIVEHLSTALTPEDRGKVLDRVKSRLEDPDDNDWILVATSCVEAGINLSFRTGFRELPSLMSLLQAAGRINRGGEYGCSTMYTFRLAECGLFTSNPEQKNAISVLQEIIKGGETITPMLVTQAIEDELRMYGVDSKSKKLVEQEIARNFPFVDARFNIIGDNKSIVVVDSKIIDEINAGNIDWRALQRKSVQVAEYKLDNKNADKILPGLYRWKLAYDDFIGYMAGVI
jgi:CRISPR/Cas system-associated endonuclease/helicase Cas3